jgi:putative PIN family toxin of toxin-antitoxin system
VTVTVDTNVLVSGVFFGGVPGRIVAAAEAGTFLLVLSPAILDELRHVFSRPKFGLDANAVQLLMADIESTALIVNPQKRHQVVAGDRDDDEVVDCAVEANATYIVSGDAHLTSLGTVEGITVLTPRQFVDLLGLESP